MSWRDDQRRGIDQRSPLFANVAKTLPIMGSVELQVGFIRAWNKWMDEASLSVQN